MTAVLLFAGVPAVAKFQYTLLSRFPIDCVLREMMTVLQTQTPDSAISVFRSQHPVRTPSTEPVYVRYVPLRPSVSVSAEDVCGSTRTACALSSASIALNIQTLIDMLSP